MPTATAKPNKYAGPCSECSAPVPAGTGALGPKVKGRWTVRHLDGWCIQRDARLPYYESLLTEGGSIEGAVALLAEHNEHWDGETGIRLNSIIAMKKALGFDYATEAAELHEFEKWERSYF